MSQTVTDSRLCFIVDYEDPQAGIIRNYQLLFFPSDNTIEMHDIKNRRVFLKRCPYPSVSVNDLYLGATLTIYSRQLKVSSYGDDHTKQIFQKRSEGTLAIIKPDGYEHLGDILKMIFDAGLRLRNMHMVKLTQEEAAEFCQAYQAAEFYRDMVTHLMNYPVIVLHLVGPDSVATWRKLMGPSNPAVAQQEAPGSIRAQLGTSPTANVVFGSKPGQAEQDVNFFFGRDSTVKRRNNAALSNCSLCIIKPHAVAAGHGGSIVSAILADGFEISSIGLIHLTAADAEDFLEVYKGVLPEYSAMLEHLSSGPCWVLEIRAENPVQAFRKFCGPHDPEIARVLAPGSLRAKFGADKVRNAVHCTDLPEDGVLEVEFFFRINALKMFQAV